MTQPDDPPERADATIDALLAGQPVDPDLNHVAEFIRDLRELGRADPPRPTPALAALIAAGGRSMDDYPGGSASDARAAQAAVPGPTGRRDRRRRRLTVGVAAAIALVAITASGVGGALPEPANKIVLRAVELVTPLETRADANPRLGSATGPRSTQPHELRPAAELRSGSKDTSPTKPRAAHPRGRPAHIPAGTDRSADASKSRPAQPARRLPAGSRRSTPLHAKHAVPPHSHGQADERPHPGSSGTR
jgi:hypothetical protein